MIQVEPRTTLLLVALIKSCAVLFMVVAVAVLSFVPATEGVAQEILIQEGFEDHVLDGFSKVWVDFLGLKITSDLAKTGKKSLAISGQTLMDSFGIPIKTSEPMISVEFWVYIEEDGRSFSLKIASDDESADNAGPDVGWDAGFVHFYADDRWQKIGKFATNKWRYVRIVADFRRNTFDFYSGHNRNKALRTKLKKRIPFRRDAFDSVATKIVFYMKTMTAPGYIDDLLVYEGEKPIALAVDPNRKLATMWGHIKRQ